MEIFGIGEATMRISVFLGVFALCAVAEAIRPRRKRLYRRASRWFTNFGMVVLATIFVRIFVFAAPLLAATAAATAAISSGWGMFQWLDWPIWIEIIIAVIVLDLIIWAQHVATHHIPILWRLHRVHHSDQDLDVTSALRFHPLEILFSAGVKMLAIFALGPAVLAVVLFEIILNASAMFNHSNIRLPNWLDRILRLVIITPDMHRVHHSIHREEHDRNFGFCLSVWDRLGGVYQSQPNAGHDEMVIGLREWQLEDTQKLGWSLQFPFKKSAR